MRLLAFAVSLCFLAVLSCATGRNPRTAGPSAASAPDLYGKVREYVASGDTEAAIEAFRAVVKAHPSDTETKIQFAHYLIASPTPGHLDEARALLADVLARFPGKPEAVYNLGLLEGATGNVGKEQGILEKLVADHPEEAAADATLGEIYLSKQDDKRAKAAFAAGLRHDPDNLAALMGEGDVYLDEGTNDAAIADFNRVIAEQPDFSFAYADRAHVEVRMDDLSSADRDLSTAIRLNPSYYWNYIDLGKLRLMFENDPDLALGDFSSAIKVDPGNFLGYVYRGGIYDDENKTKAAERDYRSILTLRPDYYFIYRPYATLLYMDKRWTEAAAYFQKASAADPTDHGPQFLALMCLQKAGEPDKAAAYLNSILPSLPRRSLFWDLARLYLDPSYETGFLLRLQQERSPDVQTRFLFYLAGYYELHGEVDLAQKYFFQVEGHHIEGMYEYRLNEWELSQYIKS